MLARARLIFRADHPALETLRRCAQSAGTALDEVEVTAFLETPVEVRAVGGAEDGGAPPPHWILAVDDEQVPPIMDRAARAGSVLGFVTAPGSVLLRLFELPKKVEQQARIALCEKTIKVDLTRCNDEVVLAIAAIGDVPFLDHRGRPFLRMQTSRWRRWMLTVGVYWNTVRHLFDIRPTAVRLHIGEEEKPRRTAVTGIVVLENDADQLSNSLLGERLSARDGRLSAMLVAPASVTAYLAALGRAAFGGSKLPRALSFVKTRRLRVESDRPLVYRLDGRRRSAESIEFRVEPGALRIKPGPAFAEDHPQGNDAKDTLKLRTLPENEARLASFRQGLPLFTHALEEDFKDLFLLLRDNARVTPDYVILMILSTLIAGLGLVLGSAAVIIGAMVLAPLMAPIVSLAMGVLRRDSGLMQDSMRAIGVGVGLALAAAAVLAFVLPLRPLTAEIESRLHPSLLDLGVAVFSGVAAAYAHSRESIMKSLPGVAIAVALVPPLAVSGIGIGWGDTRVFGGAMLLFLTNLVGISAAAALTFLVLGYAPISRAAKGLRLMAIATAALALPLYWSLSGIVEVWNIETQLRSLALQAGEHAIRLTDPRVQLQGDLVVVRAVAGAPDWLDAGQADVIKQQLETALDRPVRLELEFRLVR